MDIFTIQRGISDALYENLPGPIGDAVCLTKRELIAAMAMQGILAKGFTVDCGYENPGVWAVRAADALLAELAKPTEGGAA